jgi:hypothetical protein
MAFRSSILSGGADRAAGAGFGSMNWGRPSRGGGALREHRAVGDRVDAFGGDVAHPLREPVGARDDVGSHEGSHTRLVRLACVGDQAQAFVSGELDDVAAEHSRAARHGEGRTGRQLAAKGQKSTFAAASRLKLQASACQETRGGRRGARGGPCDGIVRT